MAASPQFTMGSDAVLDYTYDWSEWLEAGDMIASHTITASGITCDSSSVIAAGTKVLAWFSAVTAGATAICHIVTVAGREEDQTFLFQAVEK
jgi:hypothetical protein